MAGHISFLAGSRMAILGVVKRILILAVVMGLTCQATTGQTLSYQLITSGLDAVTFENGLGGLAAGDVHGDGNIDIVTIGDHGSPHVNATEAGIMVWANNGDGTSWTLSKEGDFGYGGVALGDVNNDGVTDIGYAMHHNYGTNDFGDQLIEVALGNGSGSGWVPYDDGLATNGETYGMFGVDFADVNHDGLLDLASNSFGCCNGFRVYQNNGDGTWTPTFAKNGGNSNQWCRFGDFNNDGNPDLIVATDGAQVWSSDGTGQFAPLQNGLTLGFNIDFDVADVNGDGAADLAVERNGSGQVYYFDLTTSTWQSISAGLPSKNVQGIRLADMDMDGSPEVVLWLSRTISIYKADADFNWSQIASIPISETSLAGMAIADFDHDGFNDMTYLASSGGDNRLRVYLHVPETPQLKIIPLFPKGAEHFIGGSVQFLRWLSSVPVGESASVSIQFSCGGPKGPWTAVTRNAANANRYQWVVPKIDSANCYLRYKIRTSSAASKVAMVRPFSISTTAP